MSQTSLDKTGVSYQTYLRGQQALWIPSYEKAGIPIAKLELPDSKS